jgi:glycosyltransferase involved in cell wall biosynthesis
VTSAAKQGEAGRPPLRVCIDARLNSGRVGGVEQFVIGLASGLRATGGADEEFLFLSNPGAAEWLEPYLGGPCSRLVSSGATLHTRWSRPLARVAALPRLARIAGQVTGWRARRIPRSDGSAERAGAQVVHFPTQQAFLTALPSIYHPWDLQHRHLPHLFTPEEVRKRDFRYGEFCRAASMVSVASLWHKRDVVKSYGLPPEKVSVIPLAPALAAYAPPTEAGVRAVRERFQLPESFVLYPAQSWPHKNHVALLEALALLRDREGLEIPLVCTGHRNDFFPTIRARAAELELTASVRFLGFVSTGEMAALYATARCMIFPSRFEGWGIPLSEAFHAGLPAACADIPSLRDQAGDAALLFDPSHPDEIAAALRRLWTDGGLRAELVERGRHRLEAYRWDEVAKNFRAHYRRLAGHPLLPDEAERVRATLSPT